VPGATLALRVATPSYGALIRMSVSPAHPEDGILEMSGRTERAFLVAALRRYAERLGERRADAVSRGPRGGSDRARALSFDARGASAPRSAPVAGFARLIGYSRPGNYRVAPAAVI
jgi:hypothetical protein